MTQRINDKLKKCCELCQSNLDKPCAWLSLGNEYCDTIMEVQADIEIKDKVIDLILSEFAEIVKSCPADIYEDDYKIDCENQECNEKECFKQYFYFKGKFDERMKGDIENEI